MSLLKDVDLNKEELGESEEEMAAMLEGMMGTLMSKEILYEPLKELADKVMLLTPFYLSDQYSSSPVSYKTRHRHSHPKTERATNLN